MKAEDAERELTPAQRRTISLAVLTRGIQEIAETAHRYGELTLDDIGKVLEVFARRLRTPVSNSAADDGADAS